jgi:acyl-CoA synthetase (AMP-forming)/AMP-acid ligase II
MFISVSEMIARNARMYPDKTALVEIDPVLKTRKVLTWKEFDRGINKVANAMIDRGIKKGDRVHMIMYNSLNVLQLQWGIMRMGALIAPLNFRFNSHEIKHCADVAEAKMMILEEEFIERINEVRPHLPTIKDYILVGEKVAKGMESFGEIMDQSSSNPVETPLDDDEGCSLYFTSGTTGRAKPILLTYKNLECAAITNNTNYQITHNDNFILLQPLYHAGGGMMWAGDVIVGASAVLIKGIIRPLDIVHVVQQEKVTVLMLVVPWAADILGLYDRKELSLQEYDLKCCRLLFMGAQPVPTSLIKRWLSYFHTWCMTQRMGWERRQGQGVSM